MLNLPFFGDTVYDTVKCIGGGEWKLYFYINLNIWWFFLHKDKKHIESDTYFYWTGWSLL